MFRDLLSQSYAALKHNRRRSLLTMLGMAWGIATVVLLLAYGDGFQRGLFIAFQSFGGRQITMWNGRTEMQAGGTKAGTPIQMTRNDLDYLRNEGPSAYPHVPRGQQAIPRRIWHAQSKL